jgi:hypothetical protein
MTRTILGRYEGGALHPLEPNDVLHDRLDSQRREQAPDDIEAEISRASEEARAEQLRQA